MVIRAWRLLTTKPYVTPDSPSFPSAPGPPVRLVFPEVRLTAVRIVWQPPEEPNGVILGKEHWRWSGGKRKGREICSLLFLLDNGVGGHKSCQL